jgi:heptosyltransferase-2
MKLLIIRFSSIGDIVLTTPVVRCLKLQVKDAEVHFLTKYAFAPILENNPYVDKVISLRFSWELMIHELKQEGYDYIIDLHHNLRTLRVKKALGVPSFAFDKLNIQKWLLTVLHINRMPKVHIVDRLLQTVSHLGVVNDGKGLDYFILETDKVAATDIPLSHTFGYVAVVIGAALNTKKMPVHLLQKLCIALPYPVILVGGKEDNDAGMAIALKDPIKIYNACGKFNLNESADLVRNAVTVITHDTGLMHIAAAFQKRIVSVWGNTVPAFGMAPYYGNAETLHTESEVSNLRCRPCSKIGYKKCPHKHFKCMELQDIPSIVNTTMGYIKP